MMRLTLAVVGKTLFDAEVESDADEVGSALNEVMNLFGYLMLPFSELLEKLPLPPQRRFLRARARLDAVIYRIVEERRREGRDRGDLLSTLLDAVDEEGDRTGMTNEQLRDEVMTIFLAGHETTAVALTWAWYLLARNPEAEEKLAAELSEVLGGRAPTVEDLPRLRYAEWVVKESLRLYPPAWAVGREALRECEVGGYRIPKGAQVIAYPWVIQRDPRWFTDPQAFRPERWGEESISRLPKYAYFPFGGGPRLCIGNYFATMEAVLILSTIARRFRLRLVSDDPVEPFPALTLRPKRGVAVRLEAGSAS
jgi:cytochrome P450